MAGSVVRVAAVGDLHCTKTSQGTFQPLFARVADAAELLLIAGEYVDGEEAGFEQDVVRVSCLVDADEDEHGVEGEGGDSVGGHAVQVLAVACGDDRDACGEAAHCAAELVFVGGHATRWCAAQGESPSHA